MLRKKILLSLLLFASSVLAKDFEAWPSLLEFYANPGEIQANQIKIINHTAKPQKYTLKLYDYDVDSEGNIKKNTTLAPNNRSCIKWVSFEPSIIQLSPNQSGVIEILMTPPQEEGANTRWCVVSVEPIEESTAFQADILAPTTTKNDVSTAEIPLIQSPINNNNYSATIGDLKEVSAENDTIRSFEMTVTNTGDKILKDASVFLVLANLKRKTEKNFDPTKFTLYPNKTKVLKIQLPKALPAGEDYALAAVLDYGHKKPFEVAQILLKKK